MIKDVIMREMWAECRCVGLFLLHRVSRLTSERADPLHYLFHDHDINCLSEDYREQKRRESLLRADGRYILFLLHAHDSCLKVFERSGGIR
jgi:hypothetical protein